MNTSTLTARTPRTFICLATLCSLISASYAQQPSSPLVDSFATYEQLKASSAYGVEWIHVGPTVNSARVEAVQLHPSKPGLIYAAFGSGNLWKSTNNGITWQPKFEGHASHGIGDFALAPSNPDVIYLGTGESLKKARNFTIPGTGVYRSNDGGDTWKHLGLEDSWHIGEIAVHPTNPDVALVAVLGHFWSPNKHRGLYRTEDGGESWQQVIKIDNETGANDVVWAIDDPNIAYASMWHNHPDVSGANSGVYRSQDAGRTWKKCTDGLPSGDDVGRIGLAVSHSDASKVYALIDNRDRIQAGAAQVFKSTDGGKSWHKTHKTDLKFFSRIGWYFADIYVNPQEDEEIYALGVRLAHSRDGGKTFDLLGGHVEHLVQSSASGLHLDHCEMWINPANPDHLALGNDGGLYQSFDRGKSWLHHNNLATGEFYDIALDNSRPYRIFAGAQDDATVYGPANELGPNRTQPWKYLWIDPWNGGDGCITQVDPSDPNTVYFSAQEGAFRRKDMSSDRSVAIRASLPGDHPGELKFNFVAPFIISPHDSRTLFLGGNYIFKSRNRGDNWDVISPDLMKGSGNRPASKATSQIAESPLQRGLLYAGTDTGLLWVREDENAEWQNRSSGLPKAYIRSIVPSQFDSSRVYLAMSGLNYDDFGTYIFTSDDRGQTWRSIASNLASEPANVIVEDPRYANVLYLGTFRGVYVSTDRGESWAVLGHNLPTCSIGDLEIHSSALDLVVGTHGRGIYTVNLSPVHQFVASAKSRSDVKLLPIPTAYRPISQDTRPGVNFRGSEKVTISFVSPDARPLTMTVSSDAKEPPLVELSITARPGLNQFRWDLALSAQDSDEPYFIQYTKYLPTGKYRVALHEGDKVLTEQALIVAER